MADVNHSDQSFFISHLRLSVLVLVLVEQWRSRVKFTTTICDNVLGESKHLNACLKLCVRV